MKKKKNIFMRNQRKKLFKLKGFKQALSLVMILLMCLVLLPQIPTEAAGKDSFNPNCIYIDVNGMDKNSNCDFKNFDNVKIVGLNVKGGWTPSTPTGKDTINGIEYFYWDISGWNNTDKEFAILYNNWDTANGNEWARTNAVTTFNNAKGKAFYWDGSENEYINGKHVYKLVEGVRKVSQAGKSLKFVDMTGTLSANNIVAVFGTDTNFSNSKEVKVNADGNFIVPNDTIDGSAYKYVKFKNGDKYITKTYEVISNVTDGTDININLENSVLYYGATENSDGTKDSYWSKENTATLDISNRTLYLDKVNFLSSEKTEIQIGDGAPVQLSQDENDKTTLSYLIPSGTTQQTKVTIIKEDGTKYHFFWNSSDLNNNNIVTTSNNIAVVSGKYSKSYTIYFDATLSKLSYAGDTDNNVSKADRAIPNSDGEVWCHVWKSNNTSTNADIKMTKVSSYKNGNNIWNDVYKVDLTPDTYDKVIFYSTGKLTGDSSAKTINLDIPTNLSSPCFYADSSDDIVYSNSLRRGYWNEVYTIRNPELEGEEKSNKDAESSIVDIDKKDFVRDTKTKYISTTFYDFYTDYELNGNDRDGYSYTNVDINSHRIYQPFNQFNQALSSYYKENQATDPIYWGNFQNYPGHEYYLIGKDLDLYGYDKSDITNWEADKKNNTEKKNKFFYEHHSMWGSNGQELTGTEGKNAVINLVNSNLDENGNLQINTNNGTQLAPYFNENFLEGNNAKNTVLGKVYKNVEFPFTKKALTSTSDPSKKGTVDYWEFNSADTSLEMKKDSSKNEYYLEERSNNVDVKGQKPEGNETEDGNFFPFNTSYQSGKATQLNYGFAMKLQFDFKLTNTGTVKTSDGNDVPIEFNFSGDDDVWIFIDGKLALDIGGGHGAVSGTLNFKDKKYTVSRIKNQNSNVGGTISPNVGDFTLDNKKSTHTLTMFYMERGLWESNMRVTFNFPDENKLQVEKQVDVNDVNDKFKSCFDNSSFSFNIKNQVTSYGTYKGDDDTSQQQTSLIFNDSFKNNSVYPATGNVFEYYKNKAGKNDVAHGNTGNVDDPSGSFIDKRLGIIKREDGNSVDISSINKYLQFDFYFDDAKFDPLIANMYIELEDSSGQKINGWLNSQNVESTLMLKKQTWHTILVNISKLTQNSNFNFKSLKYVKFGYKYRNDIYLDNIIFKSEDVKLSSTGFQVDESKIFDYGSAKSGNLENATGALFELNNKDTIKKVDSEGNFLLGNNDIATFINQFRRGSYISLTEEVNTNVFSTKWTLYENGGDIKNYGTGNTITNPQDTDVSKLKEYESLEVDDGRIANVPTETDKKAPNYNQAKKPEDNTIVFRSYSDPDNNESNINLKAVFVNKVRTGKITIKKAKAYEQEELTGTYKFRVTFTNVAGMALEGTNPIVIETDPISIGEEYTISGIPAGTIYCIEEIINEETDDFRVDSIDKVEGNDENVTLDSQNMTVTGVVVADEDDSTKSTYTFKNTKHKKISINLEKQWKDESGEEISEELPNYIDVQLQRKLAGTEDEFTKVQVDGNDYVRIIGDYTQWKYTFKNLDKSNADGNDYEYRIVEVEVNEAGEVTIPTNNRITLNGKDYNISYTNPVSDENSQYTITNKLKKGSITIKKVNEDGQPLLGARFKIEKGTKEEGSSKYTWSEIEKLEVSGDNAKCVFENLEPGHYRITEIQAPNGYNLLKEPIIVDLPYTYKAGDLVNGVTVTEAGSTMDITFEVENHEGFSLPIAGVSGIRFYVYIGAVVISMSIIMYFVKVRKNKKLI